MTVEVITSVQRRRRWTAAEKEWLVAASLEPGSTVSVWSKPGPVLRLADAISRVLGLRLDLRPFVEARNDARPPCLS
jgi:hypothetical protein